MKWSKWGMDWRYFVLGFGLTSLFHAGSRFQESEYVAMGAHICVVCFALVFFLATTED